MEEGSLEQTTVVMRLIAAAQAQGEDTGWAIRVMPGGIRITYIWQHLSPGNPPVPGNYYTVENFTPWKAIARAPRNPLLRAMDDLIKQKTEWKP